MKNNIFEKKISRLEVLLICFEKFMNNFIVSSDKEFCSEKANKK